MGPFLQFNLVFFYFVLGCSGVDYIDDYVPPTVRILNPVQSLTIGSEFQFEARYFNVIGEPTNEVVFFWESSDQNLLEITDLGKATPKKEGTVLITVSVNSEEGKALSDQIEFEIKSNVVLLPEETNPPNSEETPTTDTSSTTQGETVTPTLQIKNRIAQITLESAYIFNLLYTDETGAESTPIDLRWESSNPEVLSITETGTLLALAVGTATITVSTLVSNTLISTSNSIEVVAPVVPVETTSYSGEIRTTSSYLLLGGFTLSILDGELILALDKDYKASTALPGLYIYLSNNNNTTTQALEIGPVTVFQGAHN